MLRDPVLMTSNLHVGPSNPTCYIHIWVIPFPGVGAEFCVSFFHGETGAEEWGQVMKTVALSWVLSDILWALTQFLHTRDTCQEPPSNGARKRSPPDSQQRCKLMGNSNPEAPISAVPGLLRIPEITTICYCKLLPWGKLHVAVDAWCTPLSEVPPAVVLPASLLDPLARDKCQLLPPGLDSRRSTLQKPWVPTHPLPCPRLKANATSPWSLTSHAHHSLNNFRSTSWAPHHLRWLQVHLPRNLGAQSCIILCTI